MKNDVFPEEKTNKTSYFEDPDLKLAAERAEKRLAEKEAEKNGTKKKAQKPLDYTSADLDKIDARIARIQEAHRLRDEEDNKNTDKKNTKADSSNALESSVSSEKSASTKKSRKKSKKNKKSYFGAGLAIYISLMLLICFGTFAYFYKFMQAYEDSQPKSGMTSVVKTFESGDITSLVTEDTATDIFSPADLVGFIEKYNEYISDKYISFSKSKEYTDATPVFIVKANDEPVAKVVLKSEKMSNFNLNTWSFDRLDLNDYTSMVYEPVTVKIRAPKDTDIFINNVNVKDKRSDSVKVTDELEYLAVCSQYNSSVPVFAEYEITGMVIEPEVRVELGLNALKVSKLNDTFIASVGNNSSVGNDSAIDKDIKQYAEDTLRNYAYRFVGKASSINSYVMPGSKLLKTIDSTVTYFYPSSYIKDTNFDTFEVKNYVFYTDECFVCEATYDLCVNFQGYVVENTHEKGHFYMYYTKKNNKWYFTNIEYIFD